ncbi:uncharacterized protein LOC127091579 isoform X2 [Lathyrus oleraceus]|uniref:C2H2-type domain-containing protein n=1 Tax=Pisum sativum TaxID=3888 RepID=A0A9D5AA90_PEA|nr:uncharacterized protein LOC127091579 isoform X2 [Pisum sativum]KAI5400418.1 hypothetical protein KIW84_065346 [Pisum sativum]
MPVAKLTASEIPGWPVFSPAKVQIHKCDKCTKEFCSPINYRRHKRVHHRLKKLDKDSKKNREFLEAYWDKLSVEEAKEVVSFKNVMLEEVPGSSVLQALSTLRTQQGFYSFPHGYLRAGFALLDIVQSRPSSFPISSQKLFDILDDSSEKTFLCGTAVSMQRHVFDGEAGKIGLEPKNLVACTSFLLEQKLVKAWLADKDAEALRCQKLLVEEEEAAQRRQAEILERKRQKKLRQKEQKARGRPENDTEIKKSISSTEENVSPEEASLAVCDFEAYRADVVADHASPLVTYHCPDTNECVDVDTKSGFHCDTDQNVEQWTSQRDAQPGYDCDTDRNLERQTSQRHNPRRTAAARRQGLPKSQRTIANGLYASQNSQKSKFGVIPKYGTNRDQRAAPIVNGGKVWSRKPKPETDAGVMKARLHKEPDKIKNHEVLIGSVSVTLANCSQSEGNPVTSQADIIVENLADQNIAQEKPIKPDSFQGGNNRSRVKLWRPVSLHGTKNPLPLQSVETEIDGKDDQSSLRSCNIDGGDISSGNKSNVGDKADIENVQFSSHAAKAFLSERWKEAISSPHVELVISPDSELPGLQAIMECEPAPCRSSNSDKCNVLANTENWLPATSGVAKSKSRIKSEKGIKIKYIPKLKAAS